jgi:hypothetical protein
VNDLRLTLGAGIAVTTTDVTAAGTLYTAPITGDRISLYTGAYWKTFASNLPYKALSGLTGGKPYDVFMYLSGTTPTLEFLEWTDATTRATELTYASGAYVLTKLGDPTRRYLGTFYTTGTTTTEDSDTKRYLWNYYHRKPRKLKKFETTDTWTYNVNTWRQANGAAANQVDFVIGVMEDLLTVDCRAMGQDAGATITSFAAAVGLDSTTAPAAELRTDCSLPCTAAIRVSGSITWPG